MAESDDFSSEKTNGLFAEEIRKPSDTAEVRQVTLYDLLRRVVAQIFFPDLDGKYGRTTPVVRRIKSSLSETVPLLREASRNTGRDLLLWTRRGSPLRALLVVCVGTIALLLLTGLAVFMVFFLAATVNAVVISLLMCLAAVGGFLALFFVCVTAIYIGALSVAVVVVSTATVSAIIAVLIATGWVGFFWTVWLVTKRSVDVAKHSLTVTGSALSAYSTARRTGYSQGGKVVG